METKINIDSEIGGRVEKFFKEHEETFSTPVHRAVFLLGVLTQYLLNIQRSQRGSTPFKSNLKSLKMREEDVVALFPKVQNKLEEYDSNYYKKLEEVIAAYFARAGRDWGLSVDELNFVFVLGMNLCNLRDKEGKFYFKSAESGLREEEI